MEGNGEYSVEVASFYEKVNTTASSYINEMMYNYFDCSVLHNWTVIIITEQIHWHNYRYIGTAFALSSPDV